MTKSGEKETIFNQGYRLGTLNGMGLSYRYGFNDYERSDSYFRAILQTKYFCPEHELQRDKWDGVAEGNIGRNMMLRGEYDKAIPLFKSSMVKMLQTNIVLRKPFACCQEMILKLFLWTILLFIRDLMTVQTSTASSKR